MLKKMEGERVRIGSWNAEGGRKEDKKSRRAEDKKMGG
jgi:hypothetical protein